MLRQLALADADAAAQVHRIAFDHAMPWLTGLHTPEEDRWFYLQRVFPSCRVWGHFDGDVLSGMVAFRDGWIEQLYVLPLAQSRGVGGKLLDVAKNACDRLELWTFRRNVRARRFYEARGFALVEQTDGTRNEENEPDARYVWTKKALISSVLSFKNDAWSSSDKLKLFGSGDHASRMSEPKP